MDQPLNLGKSKLPREQGPRIKIQDLTLRGVSQFTDQTVIGEGTFGKVYKAKMKDCGDRFFALKKIKMEHDKEGFPITAMREVKLLKQLSHENIVNLVEIVTSDGNKSSGQVYLVFEYAEHDLQGVIDQGIELTKSQVKYIIRQMIEGIAYLHDHGIMHRDIKGGNILLTRDGIIKIADFGLAREFKKIQNQVFTVKVVTRWYRAPELLLMDKTYTAAIDVWSIGCFIAELFTGSPIFPGRTDQEQLPLIYYMTGPLEEDRVRRLGLRCQETYKETMDIYNDPNKLGGFRTENRRSLAQYLASFKQAGKHRMANHIDDEVVDLIEKLLAIDPQKRLTARQALAHPYFHTEPLPCKPGEFKAIDGELKELNTRDERHQKMKENLEFAKKLPAMGTPPRGTRAFSNFPRPVEGPHEVNRKELEDDNKLGKRPATAMLDDELMMAEPEKKRSRNVD